MDKYEELISRARKRGWTRQSALVYVEEHHIVPLHAGGHDGSENKVFLSYGEHIEAHSLLHERDGRIEDLWACNMMKGWMNKLELRREISRKNGSNSKKYTGVPRDQATIAKIAQKMKGRKPSAFTIQRSIEVHTGSILTEDHKRKIGEKSCASHSKQYIISLPSGEEKLITNLAQFSRDHNLSKGNMVARGKAKGFLCRPL